MADPRTTVLEVVVGVIRENADDHLEGQKDVR
jgi:hypothetical protein